MGHYVTKISGCFGDSQVDGCEDWARFFDYFGHAMVRWGIQALLVLTRRASDRS
jgi:hypothetical protein